MKDSLSVSTVNEDGVPMTFPSTLPATHQQLLEQIIKVFSKDPRIVGIGASGSYASDSMDKYSDLDLVIAVEPEYLNQVMLERLELVAKISGKVAAFTGEHVGEPRLIIALYEPHALHVDYKFVALPDAAQRVDDTQVLWQRGERLSAVLASAAFAYPQPEPQWIEDRFWTWVHYGTCKIARGEYFEATEFLSFLRSNVLSPLALQKQGLTPSGVRKIEQRLPDFAKQLSLTIVSPEKSSLIKALQQCIDLYLELREPSQVVVNTQAEKLCIDYFNAEFAN
ncbi:nucleotidyltransferase domain-containing protein [Shewanella pneumatophori]|uniref:Nucleotidyltransferase domain-containing protein n=1 Tax=Shewanella pneumatophori TaxID=314092 RepID=A0A9X1ZBV6_9GAMM|nr:nucleotidyltransferase domain-containing protein [Shewanella pneumatophori]MCL1138671.1 nucleotidyltransferase domain-containing protein [Shewanella pneumatophori]